MPSKQEGRREDINYLQKLGNGAFFGAGTGLNCARGQVPRLPAPGIPKEYYAPEAP
jgi:hypothetical protein